MSSLPSSDQIEEVTSSNNSKLKLTISLSALSLTLFLLIALAFPFRDRVLNQIYSKPDTTASFQSGFVCNICSADVDKNNIVGAGDISVLNLCLNKQSDQFNELGESCLNADINRDGIVDQGDLNCVQAQFRRICE